MPKYKVNDKGETVKDWKPQPKIIAAGIVGILVYVLGALGVDLGSVVQDVADVVGVNVPDQQAFSALLAALLAGYVKDNE